MYYIADGVKGEEIPMDICSSGTNRFVKGANITQTDMVFHYFYIQVSSSSYVPVFQYLAQYVVGFKHHAHIVCLEPIPYMCAYQQKMLNPHVLDHGRPQGEGGQGGHGPPPSGLNGTSPPSLVIKVCIHAHPPQAELVESTLPTTD